MATVSTAIAGGLALVLGACQGLPPGAECRSLQGRALVSPPIESPRREQLEQDLAAARGVLAASPGDRDAAIWVGRRLGYLGRHREAIGVYTEALSLHPGDPFLLRHRGHRWLTLREFGRAVADLERAADGCRHVANEVEPDGRPTVGRSPHGSLHYNVHYHRGLACFLRGDFATAERAWLDCLAVVDNDESRVAVTHWLWCVRMRLGDVAGAAAVVAGIGESMDVVDNVAYHQLCLLYAGRRTRAQLAARDGSSGAVLAFGLAHYDLVTGEPEAARRAFAELARQPGWSAFGVIAAEAELAR